MKKVKKIIEKKKNYETGVKLGTIQKLPTRTIK